MREINLEINKEEFKQSLGIKDGKDYVLTDKDKKDIASSITVPIVNRVIEKTEVIKEQPIVTNEIVEVAKHDSGEGIVSKINELSTEDDSFKIDAKHIKNLPKNEGSSRIIPPATKSLTDIDDTKILELLFPFKIGENSYMEYTTDVSGNINQVNYWADAGKAKKLFTKDITYSGSDPTIVQTLDEQSKKVLTQTISYDGSGNITSVTKVIT